MGQRHFSKIMIGISPRTDHDLSRLFTKNRTFARISLATMARPDTILLVPLEGFSDWATLGLESGTFWTFSFF